MNAVKAVHQVEVTSRCDLRCTYCPSPNLKRPKVDISEEHFMRALEHATKFYRAETQFELNLAGIGESTLHPLFPKFIAAARAAMPAMQIVFATNGLNLSLVHPLRDDDAKKKPELYHRMLSVLDAMVTASKSGRCSAWVSLHRPELGGLAVDVLRERGLLAGVSMDPSINADDWAGQVKWKRTYLTPMVCQWLRDGKVMVMADGRVTTCCLDASGVGVIGHVDDDASKWEPKPFSLCGSCQQIVPQEPWRSWVKRSGKK